MDVNKSGRLELLILKTGLDGVAAGLMKEGYEIKFGVSHLDHALLTQLSLPTMLQTASRDGSDIRIVVTRSSLPIIPIQTKALNFL